MKHHWAILILTMLPAIPKVSADTETPGHTSHLQDITRVLAAGSGISFPVKTKSLKIVGYGNSENRWNSFLHVAFHGDLIAAADIEVTASGFEEGNAPEGTLDGDFTTRWSSLGPGEWITYDFGEEKTVTGVEIAFFNADRRELYFDILVPGAAGRWVRIFSGKSQHGHTAPETFILNEESHHTALAREVAARIMVEELRELAERLRPFHGKAGIEGKHLGYCHWIFESIERFGMGNPATDPWMTKGGGLLHAMNNGLDYLGSKNGVFYAAHFSSVDHSGQPFVLRTPETIGTGRKYPLFIFLHGHGVRPRLENLRGWPGGLGRDIAGYFEVSPLNRGDMAYQGIGETDILELYEHMLRYYPVDPAQIHLTGESMGGYGTWSIGARHPSLFASMAPIYGGGIGAPLSNLRKMPIVNSHGTADDVVPVGASLFTHAVLDRLGIDYTYWEYPGIGHEAIGMKDPAAWQLSHSNTERDRAFHFESDHPLRGRHYWLEIIEAHDPRIKATVEAKVMDDGSLDLDTGNVATLAIDPAKLPVRSEMKYSIRVNGERLAGSWPTEGRKLYLANLEGDAGVRLADHREPLKRAPYQPGGLGNLFTGSPLAIVYGTQCDPDRRKALRAVAHHYSIHVNGSRMEAGALPVMSDADVSLETMRTKNLILIGGADENRLVADISPRLPVRHDGKRIHTGDLKTIEAENVFYGLFHHNPSSDRYIFLVDTTSLATEDLNEVLLHDRLIRHGMDMRHPLTTPDFVAVRNGRVLRYLQLNKDWEFGRSHDYDTPLPDLFNCPETLAKHRATEMVKRSGAAYALIAPASRWRLSAAVVDTEYFTLGDWSVLQLEAPLLLGTLTGQQLLVLHESLISEGRLLASPELIPDDIQDDLTYSIVGYTDLI